MSLALCAPQSSQFPLSFAIRKLFANLGTGTVCGQIFSSECITLFRETHESRIEEGIQLLAFFFCISLHSTQRFGQTGMSLRASLTS